MDARRDQFVVWKFVLSLGCPMLDESGCCFVECGSVMGNLKLGNRVVERNIRLTHPENIIKHLIIIIHIKKNRQNSV